MLGCEALELSLEVDLSRPSVLKFFLLAIDKLSLAGLPRIEDALTLKQACLEGLGAGSHDIGLGQHLCPAGVHGGLGVPEGKRPELGCGIGHVGRCVRKLEQCLTVGQAGTEAAPPGVEVLVHRRRRAGSQCGADALDGRPFASLQQLRRRPGGSARR